MMVVSTRWPADYILSIHHQPNTHIEYLHLCLYIIILLWWLLWANFFNCRLGLVGRSSSRYGKSASIRSDVPDVGKTNKTNLYTWKNVHLVGCLYGKINMLGIVWLAAPIPLPKGPRHRLAVIWNRCRYYTLSVF